MVTADQAVNVLCCSFYNVHILQSDLDKYKFFFKKMKFHPLFGGGGGGGSVLPS